MSASALAALRFAPRAGRDLASGIFASPLDLASGLSRSEPSNDTGENGVAYDELTSESCYWTSKDPARFGGGENLYAYAENDPVNLFDPGGRDPSETFWEYFCKTPLLGLLCELHTHPAPPCTGPDCMNFPVWPEPTPPGPNMCPEDSDDGKDCEQQYQWCINEGPTKCLGRSGGKSLCNRCLERCNAGDSPSQQCRECGF